MNPYLDSFFFYFVDNYEDADLVWTSDFQKTLQEKQRKRAQNLEEHKSSDEVCAPVSPTHEVVVKTVLIFMPTTILLSMLLTNLITLFFPGAHANSRAVVNGKVQ
jgi:hypothetical protein